MGVEVCIRSEEYAGGEVDSNRGGSPYCDVHPRAVAAAGCWASTFRARARLPNLTVNRPSFTL